MREWLAGQMDFITFVGGLAFVLFAATCFTLHHRNKAQTFWIWFGVFGLTCGINEWLGLLAVGEGGPVAWQWLRFIAFGAGFVCLFEAGRVLCCHLNYARIGRWIYIPIFLVTFQDALNGAGAFAVTGARTLGIPAGLLAALGLWRLARQEAHFNWSVVVASAAMAVHVVAAAFSLMILSVFAACGLSGMLWHYSETAHMPDHAPAVVRRVKYVRAGAVLVLVVLLAGGWYWTDQRGLAEGVVQRAQLLRDAQQALMAVEPEMVKSLSASAEDLDDPGYHVLKTRLQHLRGVMPAVRFIYLMRKVDDKIVFLVDSEKPGSKDESLPGQVYAAATPKLVAAFMAGKGVVDDPAVDPWGRWVSAYAPVHDMRTGALLAVLGVDQDAGYFERGVAVGRLKGLVPTGIICCGAFLIFVYWRRYAAAMGEEGPLDGLVAWGAAAVIGVVGVALTGILFLELRHEAENDFRAAFFQRAMIRGQVVSQELIRQVDRLDGLRRFMDTRESVEREEFRKYILPLLKDVPIRGFGWAPRVAREQRIFYESSARQDGMEGFQVHEIDPAGKSFAAPDRDEYFPVFYIEPFKGNETALGYDLASETLRRTAMEKARDTGSPVATQPLELVQEGQKKTGVLLFMPVYFSDQPQRTLEQRRQALRGFVLAVYSADEFLKGVYSRLPSEGLFCRVDDLTAPVDRQVLYRHVSREGIVDWNRPLQAYVMPLEIPDRQWRLTIVPGSAFIERNFSFVYRWVLPVGMTLTGLAAFFLNFLMMARYQAEKLVARRTMELKKEQVSLREQHELLSNVLEGTQAGTWRWDIQTGETVVNARWAQIIGYTLEELMPVSSAMWETWIHPDDLMRSRELLWGHFSGKVSFFDCEARMKHKDGHWVWVHDRGQVVYRLEDGRPRVMFGTRVDISSRKEAEAAVQKKFSELKSFLNNLPFLAWFKDAQGRYIVVNDMFAAFCGRSSPEEVQGKMDRDIWPQHLAEVYRRDDEAVMAHRVKKNMEEVVRDKEVEKYLETYKAPMFDNDKNVVGTIGYTFDVTERKQVEASMNKLKAQLIQSDKLASLGEMATGMAHEINQPLNAIGLVCATFRKLVQKRMFNEDKLAAGLEDIDACIQRMTQTIQHVRAYARQEDRAFAAIELAGTIDSALLLMGEQVRTSGIVIERMVAPGLLKVMGDPHRLEQVWINFISNARDAMDEKQAMIAQGVLNAVGYQKKLRIRVSHDKAANMLLVVFADNGKGLTPQQAQKVFDPFFTTKEVGKGTGLGLSISRGIIETHKGRVTIEGRPNEGATLRVYLPTV